VNTILKTERLILREVTTNDAPFVLQLLNDPAWIKNIGDRNIRTVDEAREYIETKIIRDYVSKGYGMWLVVSKISDEIIPIGQCGLLKRDWLDNIEIGFAFLEKYCNQGYGYEAASATMNYAQEKLSIDYIVAITSKENLASQKLLRKLGLRFDKMVLYQNDGEELMYYKQIKE